MAATGYALPFRELSNGQGTVVDGYRDLYAGHPAEIEVGVHSITTAEDLPTANFAGQVMTLLGGAHPDMGAAARAAMLGHYAWPDNLRRVDALLDRHNPSPIQQPTAAKVVSIREHRT